MLTLVLQLYLALARPDLPPSWQDDIAHRACETAVYALVAPDVRDDECTDLGEAVATALCRYEPWHVLQPEETDAAPLCQ